MRNTVRVFATLTPRSIGCAASLATARRGMEAAFATVERHCPTELSAYVDCVDANPGSWHATCNELKQSLSACAAKQ